MQLKSWSQLDTPWYATEMLHCVLCGQMIAGRVWVVQERDRVRRFCGPKCERIYTNYWVPRYAQSSPPNGGPERANETKQA